MKPATGVSPLSAERPDPRPQLRRMAHELEAVFLDQLLQAMRASVPQGGILDNAPGQEMFTTLLDQRLASLASERMDRGIGEKLYRQLERRLPPAVIQEKKPS